VQAEVQASAPRRRALRPVSRRPRLSARNWAGHSRPRTIEIQRIFWNELMECLKQPSRMEEIRRQEIERFKNHIAKFAKKDK
jgi:hypothetical protein